MTSLLSEHDDNKDNTSDTNNNLKNNKYNSSLLSISFNQDATCFSTGLRNRSCVYSCMPFQRHEFASDGGIGAMAMLYRTNLLAICGGLGYGVRLCLSWNKKVVSIKVTL